jgi:hypothetical protein
MQSNRVYGKLAGAAVALALCVNSTAAAAATTARLNNVSPLVALSVLGSDASRAALCGSAAAAASAATAQGAAPGCVLPVVDAVPPPVVETAPPPVAVAAPVAAGGFGVPWILLGLLGAIVVGAVLSDRADDEDDEFEDDAPPVTSPA